MSKCVCGDELTKTHDCENPQYTQPCTMGDYCDCEECV